MVHKQVNVASLNHGLERKLADYNTIPSSQTMSHNLFDCGADLCVDAPLTVGNGQVVHLDPATIVNMGWPCML